MTNLLSSHLEDWSTPQYFCFSIRCEVCGEFWYSSSIPFLPSFSNIRSSMYIYQMLPYIVTLIVLVLTSMRNKRENQPPESLGVPYFREER